VTQRCEEIKAIVTSQFADSSPNPHAKTTDPGAAAAPAKPAADSKQVRFLYSCGVFGDPLLTPELDPYLMSCSDCGLTGVNASGCVVLHQLAQARCFELGNYERRIAHLRRLDRAAKHGIDVTS
jgi:hypothetical protein